MEHVPLVDDLSAESWAVSMRFQALIDHEAILG
ncbi:hypothetical protein N234_17195 [Ralstonia pickettii DTP0602]|nr:hypothetical protein N234_17195 [Ralstonia pickettii DTP0602]